MLSPSKAVTKRIPLVEVFGPTVQGEGAMIGKQTYFLRFGLCDYKCKMCDSLHAVLPREVIKHSEWITQQEIYDRLMLLAHPLSTRWVTFSGGNPCIHDLTQLCSKLQQHGWQIAVETQGTFAPDWLHYAKVITVSPKGPGMGERFEGEKFFRFINKFQGHKGLNVKIVVFGKEDLEFASKVFQVARPIVPYKRMYLSQGNPFPPTVKEAPENHIWVLTQEFQRLFDEIKDDEILSEVTFLPQLHVLIWGNARGR